MMAEFYEVMVVHAGLFSHGHGLPEHLNRTIVIYVTFRNFFFCLFLSLLHYIGEVFFLILLLLSICELRLENIQNTFHYNAVQHN